LEPRQLAQLITRQLKHWLSSKMPAFCMANGWLEDKEQQFFYIGSRALEKRRTKCISLAGDYVEN